MRLFVGINLPENLKDKIECFKKEIEPFVNANFVKKDNLHLTLKFIGKKDSDVLDKIKKSLKGIKFNKLTLETSKLGSFPNQDYIKVLWLGIKPNSKLKKLHSEVEHNLKEFVKNDKKFLLHITIARVKSITNKKALLSLLKGYKIKEKFDVISFSLFKSNLTDQVPVYEIMESYSNKNN